MDNKIATARPLDGVMITLVGRKIFDIWEAKNLICILWACQLGVVGGPRCGFYHFWVSGRNGVYLGLAIVAKQ